MCAQRGFSSCDGILKYKLKVGLVIGCAKTLNEATVYSHYNKTNKYVTGPDDNLDEVETCHPCILNS